MLMQAYRSVYDYMDKHEEKICPRCLGRFECKVGKIHLCQCSTVQLSPAQRQFIESVYQGCLCANCLKILKTVYIAKERELH